MITVRRKQDDTAQKVIGDFLKRVKKSNLISRKRKIQVLIKPLSHLEKQRKAFRKAKYAAEQVVVERTGSSKKF
jgi:hypothetical protein